MLNGAPVSNDENRQVGLEHYIRQGPKPQCPQPTPVDTRYRYDPLVGDPVGKPYLRATLRQLPIHARPNSCLDELQKHRTFSRYNTSLIREALDTK